MSADPVLQFCWEEALISRVDCEADAEERLSARARADRDAVEAAQAQARAATRAG